MRKIEIIAATVVLAIMTTVPYVASTYIVYLVNGIMVLALAALSFNLLYGNTGYMNLGHSISFGVGAYAFALVSRSFSALSAALVSLLVVLIFAGFATIFILRLKGAYYAIGTLALVLLVHSLTYNLAWLTGGYQGVIVNVEQGSAYLAYHLLIGFNAALLVFARIIHSSSFGYRIRSIRGNEAVAATLGINTAINKVAIFIIGSLFAGLAGILSTFYNGFVTPESSFGISITFLPVIAAILLGSTSILGPLIGVALIFLASEIFSTMLPQFTHLMLGILLILTVLSPRNSSFNILKRNKQGENIGNSAN